MEIVFFLFFDVFLLLKWKKKSIEFFWDLIFWMSYLMCRNDITKSSFINCSNSVDDAKWWEKSGVWFFLCYNFGFYLPRINLILHVFSVCLFCYATFSTHFVIFGTVFSRNKIVHLINFITQRKKNQHLVERQTSLCRECCTQIFKFFFLLQKTCVVFFFSWFELENAFMHTCIQW